MFLSKLLIFSVYFVILIPIRFTGIYSRQRRTNESYWVEYRPCMKMLVTNKEISNHFNNEYGYLNKYLLKILFLYKKVNIKKLSSISSNGKDMKKISPFLYDQY